jgi:hypothetical protein
MAKRQRPNKGDRRIILIFGEGKTERAFVRHLMSQGLNRGLGSIRAMTARGGCPEHMVERVQREVEYRWKIEGKPTALLLLDGDRIEGKSHLQRLKKKATGIHLFISRPCIEALFLTFLEPTRDWRRSKTGTIKRHFHRSYLGERDKVEYAAYASLEALHLDALIAACQAREHEHGAWAYDFVARLLECMFGDDLTG